MVIVWKMLRIHQQYVNAVTKTMQKQIQIASTKDVHIRVNTVLVARKGIVEKVATRTSLGNGTLKSNRYFFVPWSRSRPALEKEIAVVMRPVRCVCRSF